MILTMVEMVSKVYKWSIKVLVIMAEVILLAVSVVILIGLLVHLVGVRDDIN